MQDGIVQPFFWAFAGIVVLLGSTIVAAVKSGSKDIADVDGYYPVIDLNCMGGQVLFFVFCGLILGLAYTGEHPFVYFQF